MISSSERDAAGRMAAGATRVAASFIRLFCGIGVCGQKRPARGIFASALLAAKGPKWLRLFARDRGRAAIF